MPRCLWVALLASIAVTLLGCLLLTACAEEPTEEAMPDSSDRSTGEDTDAQPVLMMGRSVMEAWFVHLDPQWDWESPVVRNGFSLSYGALQTPPDIAQSACTLIREAAPGTTVFFKFCFDDFLGSEGQEGREELDALTGWVQQVADCAANQGVILIVGNALPKVASSTHADLVRQHRAFNEWLSEFADGEASGVVHVFDQYGALTGTDGALRAEFSVSREDSHLNDAAYEELDPLLFELLAVASGDF